MSWINFIWLKKDFFKRGGNKIKYFFGVKWGFFVCFIIVEGDGYKSVFRFKNYGVEVVSWGEKFENILIEELYFFKG